MDSLLFLCARCIVTHHPLPALPNDLPADLYPILFQVAFLDGRPLVLRDLVATWPFKELHFQRLVGQAELLQGHPCIDCVEAVIQGVVAQLKQELEEPGRQSSLRVLDMTGLQAGNTISCSTSILAKACVEVSEHQQELQRCGSKRHKGCSGAAMATAAPQPLGVDVHTDLSIKEESFEILRDALQAGATGPLRLKCREFVSDELLASQIVTLLESLDPSCLRRVELGYIDLDCSGVSVIVPHLLRFPELRSLRYQDDDIGVLDLTPESVIRMQLGMLPSLRELKLRYLPLRRKLHQILGDLQAPLESLELALCSLGPADLNFLSQSFHAPALKKLDLTAMDVSEGLLEPLRLLLEKASASLLHLVLMECNLHDSDLHALLPTLLRCSRLRVLGLYGNSLSTATLKDLLQKTLELPDLHQIVYPYPKDCYKHPQPENSWDFGRDEKLFAAATAEFSRILANSGRTDFGWTYNFCDHEDLDYFSL